MERLQYNREQLLQVVPDLTTPQASPSQPVQHQPQQSLLTALVLVDIAELHVLQSLVMLVAPESVEQLLTEPLLNHVTLATPDQYPSQLAVHQPQQSQA